MFLSREKGPLRGFSKTKNRLGLPRQDDFLFYERVNHENEHRRSQASKNKL